MRGVLLIWVVVIQLCDLCERFQWRGSGESAGPVPLEEFSADRSYASCCTTVHSAHALRSPYE